MGRNVGGLVSVLGGFCSFVIGVNKNLVGSMVCCRDWLILELGVIGLLCGVPGALNLGEAWNGDGVWGRVWLDPVGDISEGVGGRIFWYPVGGVLGVVFDICVCVFW